MTYAAAGPPPPGLSPLAYAYAAALSPVLFANAARAGDGSRRIAAASAKEFRFAASRAPPPTRPSRLVARESHAGLCDAVSSGDLRRGIAVVASNDDDDDVRCLRVVAAPVAASVVGGASDV